MPIIWIYIIQFLEATIMKYTKHPRFIYRLKLDFLFQNDAAYVLEESVPVSKTSISKL